MKPDAYPAVSAGAFLAGLAALGFDPAAIRAEVGIEGDLGDPEALLAARTWPDLIAAAKRRLAAAGDPRTDAVALAVGLKNPFGSFGPVDYLVGSALTAGAALESLADHFRALASTFSLALERRDDASGAITMVSRGAVDLDTDEFTIGTLVGRFRALAPDGFRVARAQLTRAGSETVPAKLLDCPVTTGATAARVELAAGALDARMRTHDPFLHETMRKLAARLELGKAEAPLELALHARIRDHIRSGDVDAAAIGRALGMSERTLHRRLAEMGTSFQACVDAFRADESERLLLQGRMSLAEIALSVGYSDQSAWTRAFRRWKNVAPGEWLEKRRAGSSAQG